jgi:hypothetical protein
VSHHVVVAVWLCCCVAVLLCCVVVVIVVVACEDTVRLIDSEFMEVMTRDQVVKQRYV